MRRIPLSAGMVALGGGALVGLGLSLLVGGGLPAASADRAVVRGAGDAELTQEQIRWRVSQGTARSATIARHNVKVPASYGRLAHVSAHVLWFEDASGELRNVILDPDAMVRIQRE